MVSLRCFKCVPVIAPTARMNPGSEAQVSAVQNLFRKVLGPQQCEDLFFTRRFCDASSLAW